MTEYFRITGLNTIPFDSEVTGHADHRYRFELGQAPKGIDEPLTKEQAIPHLRNLPTEIASHILGRPGEHVMSVITSPFSIQGADDADMEDAEHDLRETLEDGKLYIATKGARGTRAVVEMKSDEAVNMSYKTVFWGEFTEDGGRAILGGSIKEHYIQELQMRLYCEAYWRPEEAVTLGPNEIMCPSFEEDGNADGEADNWDARAASVLSMESTIVLHGCYSQQVDTNAANEGIESTAVAAPAAPANDAVAYAWVCRPSAGSDIRAILRDTTAGVDRATALYSNATTTATGKSGETWYRLELTATNTIVPTNNHEIWVESTAATVTTFYVDKCFLKFDTTTIPDEWCDHWLIYNHYDTTEGAAHEGHQNYFDVDDLKGDVDAPLLLDVEYEQTADGNTERDLIVGRRTQESVGCFLWWLEGEDASGTTNWTAGALARCSAGSRLTDNAAASGSCNWTIGPLLGAGYLPYYLADFDVFAAVYTDDAVNTRFRVWMQVASVPLYPENWRWVDVADKWQLIHLGSVNFSYFIRQGIDIGGILMGVDYQKDVGGDVAELDCIWLIPKHEPELWLDTITPDHLNLGRWWAIDETDDFFYAAREGGVPRAWQTPLIVKGKMNCQPMIENRLYFVCLSWDDVDKLYEAHGAVTDLQMIVHLTYLPQYISPLE